MDAFYAAPPQGRGSDAHITPWSEQSLGTQLFVAGQAGGSTAAAWPAVGMVIFVPFGVPEPVTVTRMFARIAVAAGNMDLGVYDLSGNLLVSTGTTATSTTGVDANLQSVNVTDTVLARGQYYMAMVCDTTTTLTVIRATPAAGILQAFGLLQQASVTLPLSSGANPATFAVYAQAFLPDFGLTTTRGVS